MTITDDIIRDLYPLYATGEVSADTRALVEAWLAERPALAEELRRGDAFALPARAPGGPAGTAQAAATTAPAPGAAAAALPGPELERVALNRVKALLRRRGWAMAVGIFFTLLPLSFRFDDSGLHFYLWSRANALPLLGSLLLGAAGWVEYARVGRALRPSGF